MDKEKVQEKYIELQLIEQQMKQIQKQMQLVESQVGELTTAYNALEELRKTKPGTKILVPISNGIFAKAELKDSQDLIVNVGANVTVDKNVESAKGLVREQIDEMTAFHQKLMSDLQKLGVKGSALETDLQKMISDN
jgi:prefoldin alpha subunit